MIKKLERIVEKHTQVKLEVMRQQIRTRSPNLQHMNKPNQYR